MQKIFLIFTLFAIVFADESLSKYSINTLKQGLNDLKNYCKGKSLDFCSYESMEFAMFYLKSQIEQKERELERARQEARKAEKERQQNRKRDRLMLQRLMQKQHFLDRHF